ncbi:MAG: phosphate ABC transporter ATP-binding protein [Nitrososphaerales archaeon]
MVALKMIELKGVSKKFDGIVALKNIDLKLNSNGVYIIIGPSGAGKTTLLKILALLSKPTEGHIYYDDVEVDDKAISPLRRRFTMVFQNTVLFNTTVYENIAYGLKIRNLLRDEAVKRIRDVMERLGLNGLEKRHVSKLSVGQQQRVSLARALVIEPDILILDEPTANLDPENTAVIEQEVIEFSKTKTVVMSTHNVRQTFRLADRVAFLYGGLLIDQGKTSILDDPVDERVQRFVRGETGYALNHG